MAILTATLATLARRIFKACGCSLKQNCGRQLLQFVGHRRKLVPRISGGHTAGVTPVPIPNTEVKPRRADDTARVTVWERRSPPGLKTKAEAGKNCFGLFFSRQCNRLPTRESARFWWPALSGNPDESRFLQNTLPKVHRILDAAQPA